MERDEAYRPIYYVGLLILGYFLMYWVFSFVVPEVAFYLLIYGWIGVVIISVFLLRNGTPGSQKALFVIAGWALIFVYLILVMFTFLIWLGSL